MPSFKTLRVIFVAATALAAAVPATAATVTTAGGIGADTPLRGGIYANTPFGDADGLIYKDSPSLDFSRKSWLRFDLSSLGGMTVSDAALNLTGGVLGANWPDPDHTHITNVYGLLDGDTDEAWSEAVTTWNNAPGNVTGDGGELDPTRPVNLGSISVPKTAILGDLFTLSNAALVDFINADSNGVVTLILTDGTPGGAISGYAFASKESVQYAAPELSVTPVPLPAAALGLLGFSSRRRD
jgi:hypothetical protein